MIYTADLTPFPRWRDHLADCYRADEDRCVDQLLGQISFSAEANRRIHDNAYRLVKGVRDGRANQGGIDAFMQQYDLSTQEGLVLMCLAEALLRIPDQETADQLIEDKLLGSNWEQYLGQSESLFVNASTYGLMIAGKVLRVEEDPDTHLRSVLHSLVKRSSEPVIRQAIRQAMRIMGFQFVLGRSIDEALKRARKNGFARYRYSFDMLGEAARTEADALHYFDAYQQAIAALAKDQQGLGPVQENGISVKLSALHPRFEPAQREAVLQVLGERLLRLAQQASAANIGLTVDAEEAARLELWLELCERVFLDPSLGNWEGFGLVVQAYQKRAPAVIDLLADLSRRAGKRLMVRLVKGAYWDSEIKLAQEQGLEGYPVFTRKLSSDVSYLACAGKLLEQPERFYAQFATHNAYSVAAVMELAGERTDYEFQRLHGMGEPLYRQIVEDPKNRIAVRVYAPVGSHKDLLSYLVRRLLENGANSSFVNRLVDDTLPIERIIEDPVRQLAATQPKAHPRIPLPADIYGPQRKNSRGIDLSDSRRLQELDKAMRLEEGKPHLARPTLGSANAPESVYNPADLRQVVGQVQPASDSEVDSAIERACSAWPAWESTPAHRRAEILERAADLLEEQTPALMALCLREAGKTLADAIAEVREAVDFCRYYASQGRQLFAHPQLMPGPTGEHNELQLHGRGVFAAISPWNFPLAIFLGQVTAALAAGNAVLAKPAEQTPLIAARAVDLLHRAGVPEEVLQLLPGSGEVVGARLVSDPRIAGVCFTGSNETARRINQALANRPGAIVPLIAETGGQNCMIVDSSALLEQTVADVITSAFGSAGQRCSALRVLYVQEQIAEPLIEMLKGAMDQLRVGDPSLLRTDIGPVIDSEALHGLQAHALEMESSARLIHQLELGEECRNGTFFAPRVFEIDSIGQLTREVFGPVLHLIRYRPGELDQVVDAINSTGYGLTCGIQSRIDRRARALQRRIRAGNCYVNRNMIGAVVGVQPFGGEGLSGTGPKAGGPHYLLRFATERTLSINITAAGGNASLLTIDD